MTISRRLSHAALILAAMSGPALAQSATGVVFGTVAMPSPDGQPFAAPGVTVTLACSTSPQPSVEVSDDQGHFRFGEAPSGSCTVTADLQGFKSANKAVVVAPSETVDVALRLDADALHENVTVTAKAQATDSTMAAHVDALTAAKLQVAPIATDRFQDALPLIPGVVRGPDGLLNIGGARSNQSALKFNNADGTNPVTGDDAVEVPIDAVSSVEVHEAAFAPEYGMSTGAVTIVDTQTRRRQVAHDRERPRAAAPHPRRRDSRPRVVDAARDLSAGRSPTGVQPAAIDAARVQPDAGVRPAAARERYQGESLESYTPVGLDDVADQSLHGLGALRAVQDDVRRGSRRSIRSRSRQTSRNTGSSAPPRIKSSSATHGVLENTLQHQELRCDDLPRRRATTRWCSRPNRTRAATSIPPRAPAIATEWLTTYAFTPIGPAHLIKLGGGARYETVGGVSTGAPVEIVREDRTLSSLTTFNGSGQVDLRPRGDQGIRAGHVDRVASTDRRLWRAQRLRLVHR